MIELHKRHTATTIKESIDALLQKFGIESWQLYTATVDNAKNVVAAVRELRELQRESRESSKDNNDIEDFLRNNDATDDLDDFIDDYEDDKVVNEVEDLTELLGEHELVCVRCGAHTINLVVTDATRDVLPVISDIVSVVRAYKKVEYKEAFKLNQQRYPPIPNLTRWNVYAALMEVLRKGREFFDRLATNYPELGEDALVIFNFYRYQYQPF